MGIYTRDIEAIEYVLLVAVVLAVAAGIPVLLRLLRRHVARGGTSDTGADEIASRTLAWQEPFRDISRRDDRPWLPGLE